MRWTTGAVLLVALFVSLNLVCPPLVRADDDNNDPAAKFVTKTAIKHVVVIFDENNSFDHYFGTYPNALNLPGERSTFSPAPDTRAVSTDILHFRARVLAVYGQGMFMGNL